MLYRLSVDIGLMSHDVSTVCSSVCVLRSAACHAALCATSVPTFRRNLTLLFLVWMHTVKYRQNRSFSLKRQYYLTRLHGVTFQKEVIYIYAVGGRKWRDTGEDCIIGSFMICTAHQVSLG